MTTKRGFSYAEAIAYVGVGRRTFDERWRPHLVAIPQGSYLIFDRGDLDRLFDEFKRQAAGEDQAANDADGPQAQNAPRNGRPTTERNNTMGQRTRGIYPCEDGSWEVDKWWRGTRFRQCGFR
jgi:hypothetical protein